jgi:predicted nucleic acid-binding protein
VDEVGVINASPLIFLSRAKRLDLLHGSVGRVLVPTPVAEEIAARGSDDPTCRAVADVPWIEVVSPPYTPETIVRWELGPGESSVLAVAAANPQMIAILDDLSGRKCAALLGIPVRGTLGIVLAAKRRGMVEKARPVLDDLIASGLYLRRRVLDEALKRVGE